jgi:hypothetical protein
MNYRNSGATFSKSCGNRWKDSNITVSHDLSTSNYPAGSHTCPCHESLKSGAAINMKKRWIVLTQSHDRKNFKQCVPGLD